MTTTAILTAAGSGTRLGAAVPKALVPVNGTPMVTLAAANLFASAVIDELIVTVPDGFADQFESTLSGMEYPITIVTGGETRQASIEAALDRLSRSCTKVMVHDAARPFASPKLIAKVSEALDGQVKAVIPALPVTDTIKQVTGQQSEVVASTLDRTVLRAVQTPQGFDRATLDRAYQNAHQNNITGTDDASLVEALGVEVKVVLGEAAALKITTPTDLKIATLLYA